MSGFGYLSLEGSLVFEQILFLVVDDSIFKSPELSMSLLFPITIPFSNNLFLLQFQSVSVVVVRLSFNRGSAFSLILITVIVYLVI